MEGLSEKEKGLMDMDNSVVIAGGGGDLQGLKGNVKNAIKIKQNKTNKQKKPLSSLQVHDSISPDGRIT